MCKYTIIWQGLGGRIPLSPFPCLKAPLDRRSHPVLARLVYLRFLSESQNRKKLDFFVKICYYVPQRKMALIIVFRLRGCRWMNFGVIFK